ncbi:hypothetical protein BKA69DRAFT_934289 [Paraphysoderma sedebokerense]|nr:hypothetical protein BKA69DRAFT_934289 [Paraphysoderma sedebokerense]
MNASDFVMCEILWYNGVNYGNPSSPPPKSVLFSTRTIVKYIPDNKRYLHLGRDPGSAASLQLTYYHDNMYYLALLDMKSGISAPVVLKDYNDYIPVAGVGLIGIVLECGAQPDLACLVSDSMAESKIFWMKSTGIQLNFTGLNWGSIPSSYMKFQQYQNFAPNITALFFPNIAALGRRVVLYQVNPTLVSRQYPEFTLPSTGNYQDRYDNFQFTKNGDAVLFAETENINAFSGYESKINIYAYYTSKNTASGGSYSASTVLQTSQNDTASLLVPHADGSFTVVGTTMGNFSNVDSPTGLLDANRFTYQALFFVRFQGIRIRTQALEFIDVVNNKFQVTVVLDGVTEADSPTVLPSINAQTGFNPIWMNGTVSVNFTGIFYGRQTMTLSFPNIPSNPSIETAVDVPPLISLVSPLNGTIGAYVFSRLASFDVNNDTFIF